MTAASMRICLVTDELYPFTSGGIGRLLHNIIRAAVEQTDHALVVLVPAEARIDAERFASYFGPRVRLRTVQLREGWAPTIEQGRCFPPAAAFTDSVWHAQSLDFARALIALEREGERFDVIEFPDHRGWAFCAIQEKRLGEHLQTSELVVRLHGTDGLQLRREPRAYHPELLGRFELERKALEDADAVVAPLDAVAQRYAEYYGFDATWRSRAHVEFPPVTEGLERKTERHQDLVFATQLQPVQRPDVFARAAVSFMRAHPEWVGCAVFACHLGDASYRAEIEKLIPADLAPRFVFGVSGAAERERHLANGIVVICSEDESLSLAAYEASALGARLVLNGACVAFGASSPFVAGTHCIQYDGTARGLVGAIERATQTELQPVPWRSAPLYAHRQTAQAPAVVVARDALPRVSVVITNFNLGKHLPETLASVRASDHPDVEVLIVDDASTEPADRELLRQVEQAAPGVRVIRNSGNLGLSASRNVGIEAATGQYVLPLDADDCLSPTFLSLAVRALERHAAFDVVVPSTAYFRSDEARRALSLTDFALFLGNVPTYGQVANRFSCATSLIRRSVFETFRYDETLPSFEDWDLYLRLANAGRRFLVTNDIHFFYRQRPDSMIKGISRERHQALIAELHKRLPPPARPGLRHSWAMVAPTQALLQELERETTQVRRELETKRELPLRHAVADSVNHALKQVPGVAPLLRLVKRPFRASDA